MSGLWPVLPALLWGVSVAGIGGALTDLGPWYRSLKRPALQPPDWLFGPAWTLIFLLAAIAAVLGWNAAPSDGTRTAIVVAYIVNGCLNVGWNICYFKMRRPDWALVEVTFLWVSIAAMIVVLAQASTGRRAAGGALSPLGQFRVLPQLRHRQAQRAVHPLIRRPKRTIRSPA